MAQRKKGSAVYVPAKAGEAHGHYKVRLNIDGRPWIHLGPSPKSPQAEARARETALAATERAQADGLAGVALRGPKRGLPDGETIEHWCDRWCDERERRGLTSVSDDRGRLKKWVFPTLGADTPITAVSRTDIERLVEHLDHSVQAGALAWKTALNVWGLVSKLFDDATNAKTLSLRVLTVNPAAGVRGPDRGAKVSKVYVYPSEFSALVACDGVPLRWRRLFAITTYLYLRAAEVRGLEWPDFDLEHRMLHLHRSVDDDGSEASLKGDEARRVPIEPALLPLLEAMREEAGDRVRVIAKMPPEEDLAEKLRHWLKRAGVERAELYSTTKTRRRLRFHDLRASGITWRAVRGDEPLRIMRAAGHKDFATTMAYVRDAEAVGANFGEPFPALPTALLGTNLVPTFVPEGPKLAEVWRSQRELNPSTPAEVHGFLGDPKDAPPANPSDTGSNPSDRGGSGRTVDEAVDADLSAAVLEAARHGQRDVVMALVSELAARRALRAGSSAAVIDLAAARAKHGAKK